MSSRLPFTFKMLTSAQRHRIARRRERHNGKVSDTQIRTQLLDHVQHTINTQMNGIIGALEMIRKDDLPSDQCEMINLAQSSADTLLADIGQLLDLDAPFVHPVVNDAARKSLTDMRMMVVGADELARARIEEELQGHEVRVDGFGLPNAALAALEKAARSGDPYRIALLEQHIPGIDGETLGTAIGNAALHHDTLLVLISDEHNRHDAERLTHAGFSAWLPPAAPQAMLINTLDMLCGCIVKKDAPRFVCAGLRLGAENAPLKHFPLFAHCRILVVDDNPVNLQVAQQMLERFRCKVDTAKSGAQTLLLSGEQHYDLILLDCQMPQMDGYQTTALLRAAENADTHTIIIGWSAGINRNERDTCLAIGMDDFISKPMRMRALNDLLMRWLRSQPVCSTVALQQGDELEATQQMFGPDFIELAQLFLEDSPKRLAHLQEVSTGKDAIAIAKFSHVLCGSSASIGASTLAALCRELEIRAKNNALDDASSHFHAIACEYARIDAKLHGMLNVARHVASPNKH